MTDEDEYLMLIWALILIVLLCGCTKVIEPLAMPPDLRCKEFAHSTLCGDDDWIRRTKARMDLEDGVAI